MKRIHAGFGVSVILAAVSMLAALEAPFYVEEPGVTARTHEGVSCGIPFKKGEMTSLSGLSLHGSAGEVPAQFDLLSRHVDGSVQWALVSFVTDINRSQALNMTVRTTAPSAVPARPITIGRSGSVLTIDNGVLRFKVDTASFTGIDSLYYKGTPVFGGKSGGVFLKNHLTGLTHSNSSSLVTAGLVYAGALRVTLKVDGVFFKYDTGGVGFSYLLTTYAGSPKIKIDVAIKNSINPACGDVARVERCWLSFPSLFTPSAQVSYKLSGDAGLNPDVINYAGNGFGLTVHEDWGGGWYMYGGISAANFQYHNQGMTGNQLFVDIITTPDSAHRGTKKAVGYEDGPWCWLPDGFHKNSRVFLEFSDAALTSPQVISKYNENKSLLFGRPDPEYTSQTRAYSTHPRFGTFEDEKNMWVRMGGDTTGSALAAPMRNINFLIAMPGYAGTHEDFEEDPLEQYLLMWLRTGKRGFLDVGEGWSKYMKTNFTFHTDGFAYDGFQNTIRELRAMSRRNYYKRTDDPTLNPGGNKIFNSVADFRIHPGGGSSYAGCHMSGQGLVDWYCLTGDPLALAAADDMAEVVWLSSWRQSYGSTANLKDPLSPFTWTPAMRKDAEVNITREFTRHFKLLTHYVARLHPSPDSLWFQRLRYVASIYDRPQNRDPRGFLFSLFTYSHYLFELWPSTMNQYVADNKIQYQDLVHLSALGYYEGRTAWDPAVGTFKKPINSGADTLRWLVREDNSYWSYRMNAPLETYVEMTGDEDARDLLIGHAQCLAYRNLMVDRCLFGKAAYFDFPDIDTSVNVYHFTNFNDTHDVCQTGWGTTTNSMPEHSSNYVMFYPEIAAIGYHYTGDSRMLSRGFELWNRNIKRYFDGSGGGYITYRYELPKMTAKYAFLKENDWATLGDHATGGFYLFRDIAKRPSDTTPPDAVTDLYASHEPGNTARVRVTFTAPAEQGGGSVAEYQLKYDTVPIVEYQDFKFSRDYIFPCKGVAKSPWWYARNVATEPAPAAAGTIVEFFVDSAMGAADTYYVALSSRDNSGNLSRLSNVLRLTPSMIATENAFRAKTAVTLSARPNPFNPATCFSVSFPAGGQPRLTIYDVMGKRVRDLTSKIRADAPNRIQQVSWDGRDDQGRALASGIYFTQLRSGNTLKKLRVSLVK